MKNRNSLTRPRFLTSGPALLMLAVSLVLLLSGCGTDYSPANAPGRTTQPPGSVSTWTTYTDGNTVRELLLKGNDLWAATEGGIVRWDILTGIYRKYTTSNGLINNVVEGVAEDPSGDLWFVTMGGVVEYNGESWRTLTGIWGLTIASDQQGNIYVGRVDGSIYRYDGKSWQEIAPGEPADYGASAGAPTLVVDRDNRLWAFGGYPYYIQRWDGHIWQDATDMPGFPQGKVYFVGQDNDGNLWFQDKSFIYGYDGTSWQKIPATISPSIFNSITVDKNVNIWGATTKGLKRYDGKSWQSFDYDVGPHSGVIDSIVADTQGNIWCGAYGGGVLRFDGTSWHKYTTGDISGISTSAMYLHIAQDSKGTIWLDTESGLNRYDGKSWEVVKPDIIEADTFLEDNRGNLWFGTLLGTIYRYDGKAWQVFQPVKDIDDRWSINSLAQDRKGNIWVGTQDYLCRFDGKSWTTYNVLDIFGVSKTNITVHAVYVDHQDNIWAATDHGMMRFDGKHWKVFTTADGLVANYTQAIVQYREGNIWAYGDVWQGLDRYDGTSWQAFLKDDRVLDLAVDARGNIWLATDHGAMKYDGRTFDAYPSAVPPAGDKAYPTTVAVDGHDNVWFGSNDGTTRYDGKTWQLFTTADGLAGNQVFQIVAGKSGDVWVSTFGGVSHYVSRRVQR